MSDDKSLKFSFKLDTEKFQNMLGEWRSGLTKLGFKAWLGHVRQGTLTREFVKENYLPAGVSFEQCEVEVLMDELKDAIKRCDGPSHRLEVLDIACDAIADLQVEHDQEAKWEYDVKTVQPQAGPNIFSVVMKHLEEGRDVTFVCRNGGSASGYKQWFWDSIVASAKHGPFTCAQMNGMALRVTNQKGDVATLWLTTMEPVGVGRVHSPVVVMDQPNNWTVPTWTTKDMVYAEWQKVAAPARGEKYFHIYDIDEDGRISSSYDGLTRTYYPANSTRAESYGMFSATSEEWAKISSASRLTEKDIVEAFAKVDVLAPPADPPLYVSPKAYAAMAKDILEAFKIAPKDVDSIGKSISASLPVLNPPKYVLDTEARTDVEMMKKCGVLKGKAEFNDDKPDSLALTAVSIKPGVPIAAAHETFTEVKLTPAKKTCKDFCTMADLLSHGHNPGCPEKK